MMFFPGYKRVIRNIVFIVLVMALLFAGWSTAQGEGLFRRYAIGSWDAPSYNTDGSPYTDHSHYEMCLMRTVQIPDELVDTSACDFFGDIHGWSTALSVPVLLPEGETVLYARVRAVDTSNNAGMWSSEATITYTVVKLPDNETIPEPPQKFLLQINIAITILPDGSVQVEATQQ